MGGRGSTYGVNVISVSGGGYRDNGPVRELNVAGMTPTDRGSRFTNAEKTLDYIETKKLSEKQEQLQVLDRYGYVTRAFQGDEHHVSIDAESVAYMKGKIVTHNHPDVYGGTFSDADIGCLSMGMIEMRASAREGTYSMKATKKANPKGLMRAYERHADTMQKQMRDVALEVARRRFPSKEKYMEANRREQLQVIHEWYRKNAGRYGYEYSFSPRPV